MKNEVLVQKRHRYAYDHSVRATGVRMVEIETADEAERAIGPSTVSMHFYCDAGAARTDLGRRLDRSRQEARRSHLRRAADCLPPVENLSRYLKLGFDLVCFSGGKGIRGPQSAGLLLGRKDLIEAARLNTSPHSDTIARSNKVNKEEMLGMLVALELYMKRDHAADWREWERRAETIARAVKKVKSVETEVHVPPVANHVPHLKIRWDADVVRVTPLEVKRRLCRGRPRHRAPPPARRPTPGNWFSACGMMRPGDAEIVARRVAGILKNAVRCRRHVDPRPAICPGCRPRPADRGAHRRLIAEPAAKDLVHAVVISGR
jgi:L-seryl-tRNA(Ser) seleniumtransferase